MSIDDTYFGKSENGFYRNMLNLNKKKYPKFNDLAKYVAGGSMCLFNVCRKIQ